MTHGYIVARTVGAPIEPPIPNSWPLGPSNEQMLRRIDGHSESPNEEYAQAAHELLRPQTPTLEHVLVNVSPAGKMVPSSDTFDLIREGVANAAGIRPSTEEDTGEDGEPCEDEEEEEDEGERKSDEGYDDDGKADASTQVRSKDLEPLPEVAPSAAEVAPAAVASFDPPQSFPPYSGFADRRPEQSRPTSIVTGPLVQEAGLPAATRAEASGPAPFGLGITYQPPFTSQSIAPGQSGSTWSDVQAGWSAASPVVLSPNVLSPNTSAASSIPAWDTPEPFILSRDASNRVVIDQVDPAAEKRRARSLRAQALNYRMVDGVRMQDTLAPRDDQAMDVPWMAPLGDQAWNGRTWHVPATVCKRSCCDTSRFFPRKYQRV